MHRHLLIPLVSALLLAGCGEKDGPDDTGAATDADGDGYTSADDCDDGDAAVYPGATELCNLTDDNCNGEVDEGVTTTFYADNDGDGAGDPQATLSTCSQPSGYVATGDDCDDGDASAYPSAGEACDEVDNDCDGSVDEGVTSSFYADADGDGYGDATSTVEACEAGDGAVADNTDCDDTEAAANPGATEICDGIDNDCDGVAESGGSVSWSDGASGQSWSDVSADFSGTVAAPTVWTSSGDGQLCFDSGTFYASLILNHDVHVGGLASGGTVISGASLEQTIVVQGEGLNVDLSNLAVQDGLGESDDDCRYVSRSIIWGAGGLLCCDGAGTSVTATNLAMSNGYARAGGAVFSEECDLTLIQSSIADSSSQSEGGGMYVLSGTHVFEDCLIENNTAGSQGGGLYITEFDDIPAALSLVDTVFRANVTAEAGGAVFLRGDNDVDGAVISCESTSAGAARFVENEAEEGGALFLLRMGELSSSSCDFGEDSEDNTPDDILIGDVNTTFPYGDGATFTCDETGCQ